MTDPSATTVGLRLKAERERRGLSSQNAADELHLDGWIIEALEAEDYERVGPSVYVKGHLKRYAELLGLVPAEILAGYESRAQAPKPPASQPTNVRLRTDAPAVRNLPWSRILASIAALALILGLFWWKPWHPRGPQPNGQPSAAVPSAASPDTTDSAGTGAASGAASPNMQTRDARPTG
jgi:cytoskeleton protein RodZ